MSPRNGKAFLLLLAGAHCCAPAQAPRFEAAPEFQVRTLATSDVSGENWRRLGADALGRLYLSSSRGGLVRLTLPPNLLNADTSEIVREPLTARLSEITGIAWGRDTLFVAGVGPSGPGVYRLPDRNKNGLADAGEEDLLLSFRGDMADGPRDIAFGPDGLLYVLNGSATPATNRPLSTSPYRSIFEGQFLPAWPDPAGVNAGLKAPAIHLLRYDFDSRDLEVVAGGLGSARDLTFNEKGDLLTLEGENSRERGLPWHRPARLIHLVEGADYGWRSGSGVWPDRWPDQNPAVGDLGLATPGGLAFCNHNGFSLRFRGTAIVADGSRPRLLAATLRDEGSSLVLDSATTLAEASFGTIGDLLFGPGGNLFFVTTNPGGASSLHALIYLGERKDPEPRQQPEPALRGMRREMDKLAANPVPRWIDSIWLNLDRGNCQHVTQSVRRALEGAPQDLWKNRALGEKEPLRALPALFALARSERDRLARHEIIDSLTKHLPACDDAQLRRLALRTVAILRERLGELRPEAAASLRNTFRTWLSPEDPGLLIDVASSLVSLGDPAVIEACLPLLDSEFLTAQERLALLTSLLAHPGPLSQETALRFSTHLDRLRAQPPLPGRLPEWLAERKLPAAPGANYLPHLDRLRLALWLKLPRDPAALSDGEAATLNSRLAVSKKSAATLPLTGEVWRPEDAATLSALPDGFAPSPERGRAVFEAAHCSVCHDATAPALPGIGEKRGQTELLQAIFAPSVEIAEKHRLTALTLTDGTTISGRILSETPETVVLQPSLLAASTVTLPKSRIATRKASPESPMPANLLNGFSHGKIADLLSYLGSLPEAK